MEARYVRKTEAAPSLGNPISFGMTFHIGAMSSKIRSDAVDLQTKRIYLEIDQLESFVHFPVHVLNLTPQCLMALKDQVEFFFNVFQDYFEAIFFQSEAPLYVNRLSVSFSV